MHGNTGKSKQISPFTPLLSAQPWSLPLCNDIQKLVITEEEQQQEKRLRKVVKCYIK